MPLTFHCGKKSPPSLLPPVPIPGMDRVMSNDNIAIVFKLDPCLQKNKHSKNRGMAPRKGGFLGSLRASFFSKNPRIDNAPGSSTSGSKIDRRRREKGKERERDLSFVTLPCSASSLVPGKSSNTATSMSPPPLPWREDRLPKHSNIFTGVPTPIDSALTSARNSQHAPSKPGTPVHEHLLRSSRSVPDWALEQRRQYCYFEDANENELPRLPPSYKPQSASNPVITVEGVETLKSAMGGREIPRNESPKLSSIGHYKKQKATTSGEDESFRQQRSLMKSHKPSYLCGNDGMQTSDPFLGTDGSEKAMSGLNTVSPLVHKQPQQQWPDQSHHTQNHLPQSQYQIRRRSTAPAGITDDDQRHTPSMSQHRPDRPTSTSTYQAHRGHPLYPVVEENPASLPPLKWGGEWSPHLQQGSELFFETSMGVDPEGSASTILGASPLVEMGIPSPQAKTRPASWACPIRPTAGVGLDLAKSNMARHSHELNILFPPTPPSSTRDIWDDSQNSLDTKIRERSFFWNFLGRSWNVFILIWVLLLVFKSVQFMVRIIENVVFGPINLFCAVLRNFAEG